MTYASIKEPVLFWVDETEESKLAIKVLNEHHIPYCLIPLKNFNSTDVVAPRVFSHLNYRVQGLDKIRVYAKQFGSKKELEPLSLDC